MAKEFFEIARALGHDHRMKIIRILSEIESGLRLERISKSLEISSPAAEKHLKKLANVGLVIKERHRVYPVWKVVGPRRVRVILELLEEVRKRVAIGVSFLEVEESAEKLLKHVHDGISIANRDRERFVEQLKHFDDPKVWNLLTDGEKKKIVTWKKYLLFSFTSKE